MSGDLTPEEAGRRLGRRLGPLPLDVAIEVVHVLDATPADSEEQDSAA